MTGVWEQVRRLVENGQVPRVTVPDTAEYVPPKRPPGRPRYADPENPFAHYKTPRLGYARPRCLTCKRRLRKDDIEVCSDLCRERAVAFMGTKLSRLTGKKVVVNITKSAAEYLQRVGAVRVA